MKASVFLPPEPQARRVMLGLYGVLALLNIGGWLLALAAFWRHPALLGVCLVVYGFGLRHAIDADHIAAIDNVTRKLLHQGRCPRAAGFWFAMGHSAVVVLVTAAVVATTQRLQAFAAWRETGGLISAVVSAGFMLLVAAMNLGVLWSLVRSRRATRSENGQQQLEEALAGRGLITRLLRPLFAAVGRSWHMAPLGFLFGLSFDTASEIALFGAAATQAAHGVPLAATLIFPLLFAAGMSLLDTLDGLLMIGAYQWAFADPGRRYGYNLVITLMSVVLALFIGLVEIVALISEHVESAGGLARKIAGMAEHFNGLGMAAIIVFAAAWLGSIAVYRFLSAGDGPKMSRRRRRSRSRSATVEI